MRVNAVVVCNCLQNWYHVHLIYRRALPRTQVNQLDWNQIMNFIINYNDLHTIMQPNFSRSFSISSSNLQLNYKVSREDAKRMSIYLLGIWNKQ